MHSRRAGRDRSGCIHIIVHKDNILSALESVNKVEADVEKSLSELCSAAVTQHEQAYIERQTKLFTSWEAARERELQRQFDLYDREARREAVERRRREMNEEEERLFFFEREAELEQRKEDKLTAWRKTFPPRTWTGKITLKPKKVVSDDYRPPEV